MDVTSAPVAKSVSIEDLQAQIARGEFASVLREIEAVSGSDRAALRAELALWGQGPVLDLLVAARQARREGWPQAGRFAAAAARGLASQHAEALAAGILKGAPKGPDVALARKQIKAGIWRGTCARSFAAHLCAASGDRDGFVRGLQAVAHDPSEAGLERVAALATLAGMGLAERDFAASAALLAEAVALSPKADQAISLRYQEGLAWLAAGQIPAALAGLNAAAETHEPLPSSAVAAIAHNLCRQIESQPQAPPAWRFCAQAIPLAAHGMHGVVEACAVLFSVRSTIKAPSGFSMGPGCAALQRVGIKTLRLGATANVLEAALQEGALVVIEEERPTEQGFRFVLGVEPRTGLLLLRDPDAYAAELVPIKVQEQRSALVSLSAAVILGKGKQAGARAARLSARQVTTDPLFTWLDACEAGDDGEPPPAAEIRRLAERVLAEKPDQPLARKLLGEQLCDDEDRREEFLKWYADACERFPGGEWVWQIYARFLERQQRYPESGIAWAEAARLDPLDGRNAFGRAYALGRMERTAEAERFLRRAVTLSPDHTAAYSWLTAAALERREFDAAEAAAELWQAIDADDRLGPLMALANVAEERGEHNRSRALLEQAQSREPSNARVARRLAWHLSQSGRWPEARALLAPFVGAAPEVPIPDLRPAADLVALAARTAWASGDAEAGLALVGDGMGRLGPDPELVTMAVRIATTSLATPAREREMLTALCDRMANQADGWGTLLAELSRGGYHAQAEQVMDEMAVKFDQDPDSRLWLEGRTRLQIGQGARALTLLGEFVAKNPDWDPSRTHLALACLSTDVRRALDLVKPQGNAYPAAQWMIALAALEMLGELERASGLRERLAGLPPDLVADGSRVLRVCGRPELACTLVSLGLEAHADATPLLVEHLRALLALDATPEALSVARKLMAREIAAPVHTLAAAIRAQAWDDLVPIAELSLRALRDRGDEDGMALRAVLAMVDLRQGRTQARRELLARCPSHPAVAAMLARLARALVLPTVDEDEARLAKVAPGICRHPGTEIVL